MARPRPGHLSHPGVILTAALAAWTTAVPAQDLFQGRPEDNPAVSRRIAEVVRLARSLAPAQRRRQLPHLARAQKALRTREFGNVLEGLNGAILTGLGLAGDELARFRAGTCTLALPEVQQAGAGARIHVTTRLLVTRPLPAGLEVHFRLVDPETGKELARQKFTGTLDRPAICRYLVTAPFDISGLTPGRYVGETLFSLAGKEIPAPLATQRCPFYLVEGFKAGWAEIVAGYGRQQARLATPAAPPWLALAMKAVVGPLGEVDRAVNPNRGGYPLVDLDQCRHYRVTRRWLSMMRADRNPLTGLVGDHLVAVGPDKVMPMRIQLPPGLPAPGRRRALLFLPSSTGGRSDLAGVYGAGLLSRMAAHHGVIVACLHSGYMTSGQDVIGPARDFLVNVCGASPRGVTLGGHGRGASQAYYAALAKPGLWAGLVMVSGPPANPGRLAPIGGGRTCYIEGVDDPGMKYLQAAREGAEKGLLDFVRIPDAGHFLALAFGLDEVIAFAGRAELKPAPAEPTTAR